MNFLITSNGISVNSSIIKSFLFLFLLLLLGVIEKLLFGVEMFGKSSKNPILGSKSFKIFDTSIFPVISKGSFDGILFNE